MKSQGEDGADGMLGRERVMGYLDEEAVQRDKVGCVGGGTATPPFVPYRSISSSRGVASPVIDMGVLSIIGLGDGRGVIL